jgi:hypothetical protein
MRLPLLSHFYLEDPRTMAATLSYRGRLQRMETVYFATPTYSETFTSGQLARDLAECGINYTQKQVRRSLTALVKSGLLVLDGNRYKRAPLRSTRGTAGLVDMIKDGIDQSASVACA